MLRTYTQLFGVLTAKNRLSLKPQRKLVISDSSADNFIREFCSRLSGIRNNHIFQINQGERAVKIDIRSGWSKVKVRQGTKL